MHVHNTGIQILPEFYICSVLQPKQQIAEHTGRLSILEWSSLAVSFCHLQYTVGPTPFFESVTHHYDDVEVYGFLWSVERTTAIFILFRREPVLIICGRRSAVRSRGRRRKSRAQK